MLTPPDTPNRHDEVDTTFNVKFAFYLSSFDSLSLGLDLRRAKPGATSTGSSI